MDRLVSTHPTHQQTSGFQPDQKAVSEGFCQLRFEEG
jgi:hypothetical protein